MVNMMEKVHYMIPQIVILESGNLAKKMEMEKNYLMKEILLMKKNIQNSFLSPFFGENNNLNIKFYGFIYCYNGNFV